MEEMPGEDERDLRKYNIETGVALPIGSLQPLGQMQKPGSTGNDR